MKKIAFTLAMILTPLSLFGCTSNNNQSTPPPCVSPPLNEIYFAGGYYYKYSDTYYLRFNYIYVGKNNISTSTFDFETNSRSRTTIYYDGHYKGPYTHDVHEDFIPSFITPYSVITLSYQYLEYDDILQIKFVQLDDDRRNVIFVLDEKSFDVNLLMSTIRVTDSSTDSH